MELWIRIIICLIFSPRCRSYVVRINNNTCPEFCQCTYNYYLTIYCSTKNLKAIPMLPSETSDLDFSGNYVDIITAPPLRHLRNLIKLNFSHCDIHTIQENSLQNMEKLQELDLSGNNLNYLFADTFVNLADLIFLSLKGNSFLEVPEQALAPLFTLQTLDLSHNVIRELPKDYSNGWGKLKKLKHLSLAGNEINNLLQPYLFPLRDTSLEVLDLSGCFITQIEINVFRNLPHLQALKFEFSSIHIISNLSQALAYTKVHLLTMRSISHDVDIGTFLEHFHSGIIHSLDLSGNSFGNLTSMSFNNIPLLQRLTLNNMTHTPLTLDLNIFYAVSNLKSLEIRENNFEDILLPRYGSSLKNLVKLNLMSNSLTSFNLCSHKQTSDMQHNAFPKLESLYLCNNQFETFDDDAFKCLPALKILYLRSNRKQNLNPLFSNFSFRHRNLDKLDLGHNNLETFNMEQFSESPQLRELILGNNNLGKAISNRTLINLFRNLSKLEKLNLSDNKITGFPENQFQNLISLKLLDLSNNFLENLELNIFQNLPKLNSLYLSNNSFQCDCDLYLLKHWINKSGTVLEDAYKEETFICTNNVSNTMFNFPYKTLDCMLPSSVNCINLYSISWMVTIAITSLIWNLFY